MARTSTLIPFLFRKNAAKLPLLLLLTLLTGFAHAQVPIFTETVGRGEVDVTVNAYQAAQSFDNKNLAFSGTAYIDASIESDYTGASGENYIVSTAGEYVEIGGINTLKYTNLALSFGVFRNQVEQELTVEFHAGDNKGWQELTIGAIGTGVWERKTGINETKANKPIPSVENLRLRFTNTTKSGFGMIRLDDIRLSGTTTALPPSITDFTPKKGGEGTVVTITGENLQNTQYVYFRNGAIGQIIEATETTLTFTVPADAKTSKLKIVTYDGKEAETAEDFVVIKPLITDITPKFGPVGTRVTITGERLGSATYAVFAGPVVDGRTTLIRAEIVSKTGDTEIVVDVPRGAASGRIDIWTEEYGIGRGKVFDVRGPAIFDITPTSGKVGTEVTITGDRLNLRTNGQPLVVTFPGTDGPVVAEIVSSSAGVLKVLVPAGAKTGPITVNTSEGTAASPVFTVLEPTIYLSASTLDFGNIQVGGSDVKQYQVRAEYLNNGAGVTVSVGGLPGPYTISLSPTAGFARTITITEGIVNNTLAPTNIYVRYSPTEAGPSTATISHSTQDAVAKLLIVNGNTSQTSLPVELVSFRAENRAQEVTLLWTTASEKDNAYFDVEMSANPQAEFSRIGRVNSKTGNSSVATNYLLKYNLSSAGTHYFRLKQVDLDGTATYSKVIAVEIKGNAGLKVLVAPNPLNYNSKVFITADASGKANLVLHSMAGKQMYQKTVEVSVGQNELQLPLYDQLQSGLYVLTVELQGQRHQIKVVKQ